MHNFCVLFILYAYIIYLQSEASELSIFVCGTQVKGGFFIVSPNVSPVLLIHLWTCCWLQVWPLELPVMLALWILCLPVFLSG